MLTAFKSRLPLFLFYTTSRKANKRKPRCSFLWCHGRFKPYMLLYMSIKTHASPPLSTIKTPSHSPFPTLSSDFQVSLGSLPYCPQKSHYVTNKLFHKLLIYVCHYQSLFWDKILGEDLLCVCRVPQQIESIIFTL